MLLEEKISYEEATALVSNNDGLDLPFGRLNSQVKQMIIEIVEMEEDPDLDAQLLIDHAEKEATSSLRSGKPIRVELSVRPDGHPSFTVGVADFDWFVIPTITIRHIGNFEDSPFSF